MMEGLLKQIEIKAGAVSLRANLNDTPTVSQLWDALPISGKASTWGDEIYFEIPVVADQEPDARAEMKVGELGYWPVGHAFCIFFGPTPASTGPAPQAASPVNILGAVNGDSTQFRQIASGTAVALSRAEE